MLFQQIGHLPGDFLPIIIAAFFVNAQVTHNGKFVRQWGEVDQHGVAVARLGHPQFAKTKVRGGQSVFAFLVRDVHANFARGVSFGLGDGSDNSCFVQMADEFARLHNPLPTATGASAAEASSAPGKAAAGKSTTTAASTSTTPAAAPTARGPAAPVRTP